METIGPMTVPITPICLHVGGVGSGGMRLHLSPRVSSLATFTLGAMSYLATCQGKPRVGVDHAIVAQAWAGADR